MDADMAVISLKHNASSKSKDEPLTVNSVIANTWTVVERIALGGFGEIFKARNNVTSEPVAIKQQKEPSGNKNSSEISWEVHVMKAYGVSQHCPRLIAYNQNSKHDFLIMELLGPSLQQVEQRLVKLYNEPIDLWTAALLARQCLHAIQDLHGSGFIHRDIKPENFVFGLGDRCTNLYLIDYGMCKRYCRSDGKLLKYRGLVGFRGTLIYASVHAHRRLDLGRVDDLVSLLYMIYEMLAPPLPWDDGQYTTDAVLDLKLSYSLTALAKPFGSEMRTIAEHVSLLKFASKPDYKKMNHQLKQILKKYKGNERRLNQILGQDAADADKRVGKSVQVPKRGKVPLYEWNLGKPSTVLLMQPPNFRLKRFRNYLATISKAVFRSSNK